MSDEPIKAVSSVNLTTAQFKAQSAEAARNAENLEAAQIASEDEFTENCDYNAFNPLAIARRFETIEKRVTKHGKEETKQKDEPEIAIVEGVEAVNEEYTSKNPELLPNDIRSLRDKLKDSDTPEDIIKKLQESYPDQYLADEALDILIRTTNPNSQLGKNLQQAKTKLNQQYKREIAAGKNMTAEAREFAKQGLGTPSQLRELYKDVTGNPKEPTQLFEELAEKYDYKKMTTVIKFLLHSIGSDMRSKGPSISRPELQVLFSETRAMQAILGIYRFFQSRMGLINKEFERNDLLLPGKLNFEVLAKQFVKIIADRYPSVDKILKLGISLGIGDDLIAQIIIYTQYRDAMRQVAPRLFKSEKQRQDILMTLLDALSDLEDELDEEEEDEEEE
jgi:type III secretion protein W